MPLYVIPARKGTTGSWNPSTEWKKEQDKYFPEGLNIGHFDQIIQGLANIQMSLEGKSYSEAYYPFYQGAVSTKAFDLFEKEVPALAKTEAYNFVKGTYDTNDTYLKFSRFSK